MASLNQNYLFFFFLRHAYGQFYHDFSNVDLKDHTFVWQYTYALLSFRDAALRYAHRIKVLHATRIYSTLPETTPVEARERYPNIMTISADGSSKLTNAFQKAIDDAKAEADRVAAQVAAQNAQGFGGAPHPAPVNGA